jgi:RHS repeat-associated protein
MKNYILILILLLLSVGKTTAQAFSDDNLIYTASPKKAVKEEHLKTLTKDEISQSVTYFDGLGRPVQTIAIGQGGNAEDIITPIEYDGFGRQEKEYLPFSLPNSNNQYPKIEHRAAVNGVNVHYATDSYGNTTNPYSQKKLESSPLNRVLKQAAPGNDWAMKGGHEIKMEYQTNAANEVREFEVITSWNAASGLYDISFWDNRYYDKNELYKTIVYDENSSPNPSEGEGSTIEFKNKEGQVVLKRTYESGIKHDTYYVHDEYGNLTYVIPPKADGVITEEILNSLCYQYKHDNRNRMVEKKIPGKQWEFIVYDILNRPVATGPAFSPFTDDKTTGWLITKYDALGRQIYTGWSNTTCNATTRGSLQQSQNSITIFYEKKASNTIDGISTQYTNTIAPTSFKLLTVTYYDDYNFPNGERYSHAGVETLSTNMRMVTGNWTRVPTTTLATLGETTTIFYDLKRRPVQNIIKNHLGGYIDVVTGYDFMGKTLYKKSEHLSSPNGVPVYTSDVYTYTPHDRLLTHTHRINGNSIVEHLSSNGYDSLGQLVSKSIGNTVEIPLQKIDYKYNIRGWLTGINNPENLQQDSDPRDLFAFKINYNKVEASTTAAKALYNGNIAETFWATGNDGTGVIRGYGYQYDQLNRLKNATYQTPKLADNKNYFGESLQYDKNGNIKKLQRKFMAGTLSNPYVDDMDDLDYSYASNSNQLLKVTDATNNPQGFKSSNKTGDDYEYDLNGNLIKDNNKDITEISYNHLNLPKKIIFASGDMIQYIYNGIGQKAEKIVTEKGVVTNTKYLNGFQYKNNVLQFFPTAEGYVRNTSTNPATNVFQYVFNYTDHLGNVRVSYVKNPKTNVLEILEENSYFSFGLKHQGYNTDNKQPNYKYKYNGKELQDELSLNLYDYGARNYDPALGRWMNIDPLAEQMRRWSPYNYAFNNPMRFIDPDGMGPNDIIVNGSQARKFTEQLNSSSNLAITRNDETGKLSATGTAKTKADKKLLEAINSKEITVNINATSDNFVGNNVIFGGAFGGSEFNDGTVVATQVVNPIQAGIIEDLTGMPSGTIAMHETLEAYVGAVKSPGAGGFNSDVRSYEKAHKDAMKLEPNAKKVNTLNGFRVRASNENRTENTATYNGVIWKGMDYRQLFIDENVPIKRE